jgi:hypothetical protein
MYLCRPAKSNRHHQRVISWMQVVMSAKGLHRKRRRLRRESSTFSLSLGSPLSQMRRLFAWNVVSLEVIFLVVLVKLGNVL